MQIRIYMNLEKEVDIFLVQWKSGGLAEQLLGNCLPGNTVVGINHEYSAAH